MKWLALIVLLTGCAQVGHPVLGAAPYVRAHFDRLDPAKVGQFDAARKAWVASVVKMGGTDRWWGSYFEVQELGFLSLRPLASISELALHVPDSPKNAERAAAVERYNRLSDEGLVFPHLSQVWSAEEDLSYQPPGAAISLRGAAVGRMVFEGLMPTRADAYEKAWKTIHAALASVGYPVARFTFSNLYGDLVSTETYVLRTRPDLSTDTPSPVAANR